MKIKTKRNYLLTIILSTILIIGIINITNGTTITTKNINNSDLHRTSIFSLLLGNDGSDSAQIKVTTGGSNLNISSGLIIGNNNAGIAGGTGNKITGEKGAIGGGRTNTTNGENGVVAGGYKNKAEALGVVLGGNNNKSSNGGIILGGEKNNAQNYSLALGQNAKGNNYSFVWNDNNTKDKSAYINTSGGMLIGTYNSITGTSLVVSGTIKLGNQITNNTGSIISKDGCIKFYDGTVDYTLGKASSSSNLCGPNTGCQFGKIILHNGDKVDGYLNYYGDCETIKQTVTCKNGKLYHDNTPIYDIYPNCYNSSSNPTLTPIPR